MPLSNPRDTFKALLLDYDALLEASDKECSYCLSEREIQMLLAFVEYIGWKTRYIATPTEIDGSLILHWQDNLARKLMSGCCGEDGTLSRFTEDGVFQQSDDGGATWHDAPEADPRNNTIQMPPIPGEDGEDKKCNAAASGMTYVKNNLIDSLNDGMAYGEVTAVAAAVVALLGVTGVGILLAAITGAIMLAGVLVIQAAFTSEVWADYQCLLFCNMEDDGSFTLDGWGDLKNDINSTFTGVTQIILWTWVNSVGYIGLTNSVRTGIAEDGDCSDCDCECGGETIGLTMDLFFGEDPAQTGCNVKATALADGDGFTVSWQWDGSHPFKITAEGLIFGAPTTVAWQWYLADGSGPFSSGSAPIGVSVQVCNLHGTGTTFRTSWDVATP